MTLPGIVAAAMFIGVIIYAVFAGADFGSGFYDLTAGGGNRGAELRTLIDHSIGPVWEANHVWLIYVLVMWWSGFPSAFAASMTTLNIPLALALTGIVLRGTSFSLRKYAPTFGLARLFGAVFAGSSLITPFFFGTAVGAIASGRVPAKGSGDRIGSWLNATSLVGGALAVATCVLLAGVFLTADAERNGDTSLAERLRRGTLGVGGFTGAVVLAGLPLIVHDAPTLSHGLLHAGFALLALANVAGVLTLFLLYRRNYSTARYFAVVAVAAVISGWGVGQYPWMLVDQLTIDHAAGASTTLTALLVVVGLAVVLIVPSLVYLFKLSQSGPSQPYDSIAISYQCSAAGHPPRDRSRSSK
jgi:cytochrome bd ubiquinol oxidase subunit II